MTRTRCFLETMKCVRWWTLMVVGGLSVGAGEGGGTLVERIMNAADRDKDGRLTLQEYKTLDVQALHHGEEHFKAGDANGDGFLDSGELAGVLRKQTWFAILSEGEEACFARLDVNKDGVLDPAEYRKVSRMVHHSDQHFHGADANKDGFLDLAEFIGHANYRLRALENGGAGRAAR